MPIDPRIAMGFQPTVQLESPLNRFAKFAQIQEAQNRNALAQYQLSSAQRADEAQNALSAAYKSSFNPETGAVDPSAIYRQLAERGAGHLIPDVQAKMLAQQKEQAGLAKTQAETKASQLKLQQEQYAHGIQSIGSARSAADVMTALDDAVKRGYFSQEQADATKSELASKQTLPEFQEWQQKKLQGLMSAEKQLEMMVPKPREVKRADGSIIFLDENPNSPTFKQEIMPSQAAGMTPADAQRLANERVRLGYEGQRVNLENRRVGVSEQEATRKAAGADLKPVPTHAQKAIVGSSATIDKLNSAIESIEKGPKEGATGFKGILPNLALNRLYPEGTEARANVADIGSLVMHERSGAAVTASEAPRLKPFIPLITDDKETVLKKLKRMRDIQIAEQEALVGTYSPEQGFKEFKPVTPPPKKETGGLTPEEQAELAELRARYPKKGP